MILTKYFEVVTLDGVNPRSQYQKVMLIVHSLNSTGAKLVVGWPRWASSSNYFGGIMRVFGTPAELEAVRAPLEDYVSKAMKFKRAKKPIIVGPVSDVPLTAKITWVFKRHRAPARQRSTSHSQRLIRRAIARGEKPKEFTPQEVETHTIMLASMSSNQIFPMDIRRERPTHLEVVDAEPSSYGLNVPIPQF